MSNLAQQLQSAFRMCAEAEHRRWSSHDVNSRAAAKPS